jgi:hypothetical protein
MDKKLTDFTEYLKEEANEEYRDLFDYCIETLLFSVKVNVWHWTCETDAQHIHLNKIYNMLREFPDTITEVGIGKTKFDFGDIDMPTLTKFDKNSVLSDLSNFRDKTLMVQDEYKDNSSINKLFTDAITEYDHEISLMKNFK